MTPARQELVRLALEMPEGGVVTIARAICWICPGMAKPRQPMLGQDQIALLTELEAIATDPHKRAAFSAGLAELKAGYVPTRAPPNVVELFPAERR